jgi:hypothetical protein
VRERKEGGDGEVTVDPLIVLLAELEGTEEDARDDRSSLIMSKRWSSRERRAKRWTLLRKVSTEGKMRRRSDKAGTTNVVFYLATPFFLIGPEAERGEGVDCISCLRWISLVDSNVGNSYRSAPQGTSECHITAARLDTHEWQESIHGQILGDTLGHAIDMLVWLILTFEDDSARRLPSLC